MDIRQLKSSYTIGQYAQDSNLSSVITIQHKTLIINIQLLFYYGHYTVLKNTLVPA